MKQLNILIAILLIILIFCACSNNSQKTNLNITNETTQMQQTTTVEQSKITTTSSTVTTIKSADDETTSVTAIQKAGDMIFTDEADNKFITAISQKYNVDSSLLACIYTSTQDDRNYVWQFKNTKDTNGKIIKTADTLQYVYIVSQDCQTIKRTGGYTGNINITPVEGYIVFEAAKQMFIPQHQQSLY